MFFFTHWNPLCEKVFIHKTGSTLHIALSSEKNIPTHHHAHQNTLHPRPQMKQVVWCVYVCLYVRRITFELNDLLPRYFVYWFILTLFRSSLNAKVIGQSSLSQEEQELSNCWNSQWWSREKWNRYRGGLKSRPEFKTVNR